ncbi:MAG: BrnA antitoxin family protein [Nitrospirae bacterium]|nr:BrnA antitoxin family protein [Nitrospirota bacterium]
MKSKLKEIPVFKSEDEEREFWADHDTSEYFNYDKAEAAIFPNLKPSVRSISIRLPEMLIAQLKMLANEKDVPYQSLIKIFLAEKIESKK